MKIELPLRSAENKNNRHRLIQKLYSAACNPETQYHEIVECIRTEIGLHISLGDVRQLVLYSGLFGPTDIAIPSKKDMQHVIKKCLIAVPRITHYKKWCKDVKWLENNRLSAGMTKGYFANCGESECISIMSLIEDFQEYDEQNGDDVSEVWSGDEEDTVTSTLPKRDLLALFRSTVKVIINLTRFMGSMRDGKLEKIAAARRSRAQSKRKKGVPNIYERRDKADYNKLVFALGKGGDDLDLAVNEDEGNDVSHMFSKKPTEARRIRTLVSTATEDDGEQEFTEQQQQISEEKKLRKKEKQKVKITKLSKVVSLRPSLAKVDMMEKIQRRRQSELSQKPPSVKVVDPLGESVDDKRDTTYLSYSSLALIRTEATGIGCGKKHRGTFVLAKKEVVQIARRDMEDRKESILDTFKSLENPFLSKHNAAY